MASLATLDTGFSQETGFQFAAGTSTSCSTMSCPASTRKPLYNWLHLHDCSATGLYIVQELLPSLVLDSTAAVVKFPSRVWISCMCIAFVAGWRSSFAVLLAELAPAASTAMSLSLTSSLLLEVGRNFS